MLASTLQDLGGDLDGMHYSLCDSAGMAEGVFTPGGAKDLTVVDTACCAGPGPFGLGLCNTTATLCPNRTDFVFWDSFHPTEYASGLAASALFADSGNFVRPINVGQLAAL